MVWKLKIRKIALLPLLFSLAMVSLSCRLPTDKGKQSGSPGITIDPTDGLLTTETGGTDAFTIVLDSQPDGEVTIGLSSSDPTEGQLSASLLTFSSDNWSAPQTVTVLGVDDLLADGNEAYTIITAQAGSTDPEYNELDAEDVSVLNIDNDSPGITVDSAGRLFTTEGGGTDIFSVVLNTQPAAEVRINLSSSDPTEATVGPPSLTFTPDDWDEPQTVTVTGADDQRADGIQRFSIATASASSSDPSYDGIESADVPATNIDDDMRLAAGENHTILMDADGTLWAWGSNGSGQLGDGMKVGRNTPTQIGADHDWAFAAAGIDHSVALKANGTLWAWGSNSDGKLGIETYPDSTRDMPTKIGPDTDWSKAAAGSGHTVAIKTNGTLWCWGRSRYFGPVSTPTQYGPDFDWAFVAAGFGDAVAIKANGSLWVLGKGRVGIDADWSFAASGYGHTVAIKNDGTLWAWGSNDSGQLGDGTYAGKSIPTRIGTDNDWAWAAAGYSHTVAMKTDGSLWAWGMKTWRVEEDGAVIDYGNTPTRIGADNQWRRAAAGGSHTAALKQDGTAWTFGLNNHGQLGNGTTAEKDSPVKTGNGSGWASLSIEKFHAAAVKSDGTLWTWGMNNWGQLGDGTGIDRNAPTRIGTGSDWLAAAVGGSSYNVLSTQITVVVTDSHTAAVKTDGTLWAWGRNQLGQLGDGTNIDKDMPARIGTDSDWAWVEAGGASTYALKSDGSLWAWGWNSEGQLGDGTTIDRNAPTRIGTDTDWAAVTAAFGYTMDGGFVLALKTDGTLWGWGRNDGGYLGDGTNVDKTAPTRIGTDADWAQVSAGGGHTVAIKTDGSLWAWGSNWTGQLGDGTNVDKNTPTRIGSGTDWASAAAGSGHTLAAKTDGTLWAWGSNSAGQLGDGTRADKNTPVKIGAATDWSFIAAGTMDSLALKEDGDLWAWGRNNFGQLGDGTAWKESPVQVK